MDFCELPDKSQPYTTTQPALCGVGQSNCCVHDDRKSGLVGRAMTAINGTSFFVGALSNRLGSEMMGVCLYMVDGGRERICPNRGG